MMTPIRLAAAVAALVAASAGFAQSPSEFLRTDPAAARAPEVSPPDDAPPTPLTPARTELGPGFVLRGVRLDGATAVTTAELEPLWADLVGTPVSLAEIDAIAASVAAAYRARGYILSQAVVPPQTIADGVVAIRVIEGFVDRLAITGGAQNQRDAAATLFAPVPADRPLRLHTLERAVLLSRDTFGGGADTAVEASPTTFGAADMTVAITQAPIAGFASADNRGSRLYGPGSFVVGGTAFNRLGLNERLGIIGAGALDGSLGYIQGSASLPLFRLAGTFLDGATLELEADYANGEPDLAKSGAPDIQTLTTNETNLRAAIRVPFIRTRQQNLFGELGLDWQDSDNVTGFGPDETTAFDRLLVLDASLSWDRADRFGGVSLVEAGLRQGIDTSNTFVGGELSSGEPDFTLLTLDLARLQRIQQGPWAVWFEFTGQYAAAVLPNSERFSLGDSTIGRGYAPGNTTGDSGYGGRAELRRQVGPETLRGLGEAAELYAYGDYGRAYDRDADRDGEAWQTLASAGFGVRLDVRPWLTITPEIARQLDGVPTDTTDPNLETRFYIGVLARF